MRYLIPAVSALVRLTFGEYLVVRSTIRTLTRFVNQVDERIHGLAFQRSGAEAFLHTTEDSVRPLTFIACLIGDLDSNDGWLQSRLLGVCHASLEAFLGARWFVSDPLFSQIYQTQHPIRCSLCLPQSCSFFALYAGPRTKR